MPNELPVEQARVEEMKTKHCYEYHLKQTASSRMEPSRFTNTNLLIIQAITILLLVLIKHSTVASDQVQQTRSTVTFPGVTRDLASFCAARPSLPIDLAAMIVHVKKNISFNYKLYLFSADHVFQTGQVIPRDDFRIHSFPVKLKLLNEFWPENVATQQYIGPNLATPISVPSSNFNLKQFMSAVPLVPQVNSKRSSKSQRTKKRRIIDRNSTPSRVQKSKIADEIPGEGLPGDEGFISHDVARVVEARSAARDQAENLNKHIQFDRDDQLSVSRRFYSAEYLMSPVESTSSSVNVNGGTNELKGEMNGDHDDGGEQQPGEAASSAASGESVHENGELYGDYAGDVVVPVGSFSSFHVNQTYLVRKDFGQVQPQLVRIIVDANQFVVSQLQLISNGSSESVNYPQHEDYNFLSHKLLRDPNTRITSITQIYEDWITRNFYTIVYIQRRSDEANNERDDDNNNNNNNNIKPTIINDRLVFRGASIALLGADQLDYNVKAAAFITEKNGLHYYLEFITTGKFYLCAVDWTKRPFKMIDSSRFPIKATKTQLDNEELLLCPPAVCYSNQPIDEIVSYGRVSLPERFQKEAQILSKSLFASSAAPLTLINVPALSATDQIGAGTPVLNPLNETTLIYNKQKESNRLRGRDLPAFSKAEALVDNSISLDSLVEAVKGGSSQLQTRLHLRDWVWTLSRLSQRRHQNSRTSSNGNSELGLEQQIPNGAKLAAPATGGPSAGGGAGAGTGSASSATAAPSATSFEWRHELARRNDIKVKPDTYGYVLTGHEIDASYRVYNELYLISANHLITINYTMSNETVISTHPIGDEFVGLSSTLLEPITGAYYDRYANQIYFFKGDRYIGYDYASKKALSDFVLESPLIDSMVSSFSGDTFSNVAPLVSSLPVVGILGRQHQVDGVYHDFLTDLVYIFTGMKFYSFGANEFKNGSFKPETKSLPKMYCINEHFLHGCNFDAAYKNPCRADEETTRQSAGKSAKLVEVEADSKGNAMNDSESSGFNGSANDLNFSDEQQMKLRSIASRAGLLNILVENSLLNKGATRAIGPLINGPTSTSSSASGSPALLAESESQNQGKIVVYLLIAMIVLTVVVTMAMILVIINWTRVKLANTRRDHTRQEADEHLGPVLPGRQYLSNQHHHSRSRQQQQNHHHHHHHHNSRHTSRSSAILDKNINVKPLSTVPAFDPGGIISFLLYSIERPNYCI